MRECVGTFVHNFPKEQSMMFGADNIKLKPTSTLKTHYNYGYSYTIYTRKHTYTHKSP